MKKLDGNAVVRCRDCGAETKVKDLVGVDSKMVWLGNKLYLQRTLVCPECKSSNLHQYEQKVVKNCKTK